LDCGGMRKATLRGRVNLQKRHSFAATCYNLSQLLRKKFGYGTLKMALARGWRAGFSGLAGTAAFIRAILTLHTPVRSGFFLTPGFFTSLRACNRPERWFFNSLLGYPLSRLRR